MCDAVCDAVCNAACDAVCEAVCDAVCDALRCAINFGESYSRTSLPTTSWVGRRQRRLKEARTYRAGALRLPQAQLKEAWAQNVQD